MATLQMGMGCCTWKLSLSINEYSYVGIIEFALAVWWDMDNGKSKMRKNLRKLGVKSDNSMIYMYALSHGFCVYLKEGAEAGVHEIKRLFFGLGQLIASGRGQWRRHGAAPARRSAGQPQVMQAGAAFGRGGGF